MSIASMGDLEDRTEVTPLLETSQSLDNTGVQPWKRSWHWITIVVLCITVATAFNLAEYLFLAPKVRLFESIACLNFYSTTDPSLVGPDGSVSERYCKLDIIQDEVTTVLGWQFFFDAIPGILFPIPCGWIADRYGRKWVLVMSLLSFALSYAWIFLSAQVLQLPLEYTWISSAFHILGGGPVTGTTMITTLVADVVPLELRSSVFLYRFASELVAEFVTPPITSSLMAMKLWFPLVLALGFQGLGLLMALALPETLPKPVVHNVSPEDTIADSGPRNLFTEDDAADLSSLKVQGWATRKTMQLRKPGGFLSFVLRDKAVFALLLTFLFGKVGRQWTNLTLQYVSIRYGWSLSKAGLLFSLSAGVNILLYTAILPIISTYVLSKMMPSAVKDLLISRASIILMVLGPLAVAISSTPVLMIVGLIVYTLGTGFAPLVRSLITSLVEAHDATHTSDIGRLYAAIAVMEGIGSLMAGPGMAYAFRIGLRLGNNWLGLPFGLASALFVLNAIVVLVVRVD